MFCTKCGNKANEGDAYCAKCGEKLGAAVDAKKKSNKVLFIVLFGCLGLMFVVPVVGIMAAIAVPRFAQMLEKSREGASKGNLASIRSAISIYYSENEKFPTLEIITSDAFNKYLPEIPAEPVSKSSKIVNKFDGNGGWYYCDVPESKNYGNVLVNLDRNDTKGVPFKEY